ncbi:Homoserine kinase type II OS=Ureibacillus acetophenoni OX=614649 GN=SAMN05877842_11755 PE=3 SV=1 [Ureibacillus acetophenoni]
MKLVLKKSQNDIFLELKEATENLFGLHLENPIPINLGYINLKWKVESEKGLFVIKQISKERYAKHDFEVIISEQELALHEQLRQFENGTLCPKVLIQKDKIIHKSSCDERFIIMEFVDGKNLLPGTLNEKQMYSLGQMTAHMHNVANDGTYSNEKNPKFIPQNVGERLDYWNSIYESNEENNQFRELVENQMKATKQFNLGMINSCDPGWAHRDLWVDNILFRGDELSAILDFDRFAFDYPELDIARAIMSGALNGDTFNENCAKAFLDGYRTKRNLEKGVFVRSLYLLWYMESPWWIRSNLNYDRYQEVQFQNEMIWLGENLYELSEMFENW